jgi:uncharacterized protein (UPF0276 family)
MIQLTTNLSDPLLDLLRDHKVPLDGVEVGPWFSLRQVRAYRRALPGLPFTFHASNRIDRVGLVPGALSRIAAYQRCTGSPWVSIHVTLWLPGMVGLMLRYGWRMPLPDVARATRRFVANVQRLQRSLPVPVLLENTPPFPFPGYDFEARAARIREVLDQTGCGFLLDIGHARVAADAWAIDVLDYLRDLPLERVVQVHVSGPRVRDLRGRGPRLVDAHEPLQDVDYALLDHVLARARPQMVTLEYIREREALLHQLTRLRALV